MNTKTIDSYKEVKEVLNLISDNEKNKIPENLLMKIDEVSGDDKYTLKYDIKGRLILSKDAEAMLLYLYDKYILDDNQQLKRAIFLKTKSNQETKNIIKDIINQKNKPKDLYVKNKEKTTNECPKVNLKIETTDMIVRKKDNILTRIISKIKHILK